MLVRVAIFPSVPAVQALAITLAQKLNLPLVANQQAEYDYFLILTPHSLTLQKAGSPSLSLCVNFLAEKMLYRRQQASLKNEALARALGLKGKIYPKIVDATGGLAGDGFIVAALGFDIVLLERSAIVYALVADGIQRAREHAAMAAVIDRLRLIHVDAIHWLQNLPDAERPDIIYLDPMFPERKKSALPKQEMLILHDIVGNDRDADALFKTALACAIKRVVVKRPRLAVSLAAAVKPSFSLTGSSSRFDVYLT
jgi:16S rRNA (guanine1516-N2)-methyltransferase